jgi:hypothetical protein
MSEELDESSEELDVSEVFYRLVQERDILVKTLAYPEHKHAFENLRLNRENTSLREQLRVAQERWISVNERLPQLTEPVFVLLRLSDEHKNVPAVAQLHHDRWITTWRENVEVTHWMPLPTPPAESTEGK